MDEFGYAAHEELVFIKDAETASRQLWGHPIPRLQHKRGNVPACTVTLILHQILAYHRRVPTSNDELAKKMGCAANVVHRILKLLYEAGIIDGFDATRIISVDFERLYELGRA